MTGGAIFLGGVGVLVAVMGVGFYYLGGRSYWARLCGDGFECGFDMSSCSRVPFSLRFFILTVVFLVFDVEIVLLLPLPFIVSGIESCFVGVMFLGLLILGLAYEWYEGSLDWEI